MNKLGVRQPNQPHLTNDQGSLVVRSNNRTHHKHSPSKHLTKTMHMFPAVFGSTGRSFRSRTVSRSLFAKELIKKQTRLLITAQCWGIYNCQEMQLIKGFKVKQRQQISNISKVALFYTALLVIGRYSLDVGAFKMYCTGILPEQHSNLINDELTTLEDILYHMMLTNSCESSFILAANLGLYMHERRKGRQHYDVLELSYERVDWVGHCKMYLQLTNEILRELKLESTTLVSTKHLQLNTSSVRDIALLTFECLKFPLFREVVGTLYREIPLATRDQQYRWSQRIVQLNNPNRLMRDYNFKGVKTSYTLKFGGTALTNLGSIVCLYQHGKQLLLIIVLGSSGKNAKYSDTEKILDWYRESQQT